jgi:outer membrane protein OmpA-like peptidoglycan-associated protein
MQVSDSQALPVFDGWGQLDALSNGAVDALAITRPMSSSDVAQMVDTLSGRAQLLEFTNRQRSLLGQGWLRHPIPTGTYVSLDHDVDTVARSVMLLTDATVDDGVVYQITRTVFENLPFLANIDETGGLITLNNALTGMNLSIHPGAARFYQEVGLLPSGSTDPGDARTLLASESTQAATTSSETPIGSEDAAPPIADNIPRRTPEAPPAAEVLPSFVLDDTMLNRSRAEIHDGAEVLKIDRPEDLDRPGTEIVNVYFRLGDTQPNGDGFAEARSIGQRILQLYRSSNSVPEIYVEGHADRSGDWKVNYEIAHSRAVATKEIMVAAGVPDDWIHISDHSEQKLAVATPDGVGDWRNRRVEVTVIPGRGQGAAQRRDAAQSP